MPQNENGNSDDQNNTGSENENNENGKTDEEIDAIVDEELGKDPDLKNPAGKPDDKKGKGKDDDSEDEEDDDDSEEDDDDKGKKGKKSGKDDEEDDSEDEDEEEDDDDEDEDEDEDDDEDLEDPDEMSITVEDKNGKKYKIKSEDDLPDDFEAKSNKALVKIYRQLDQLDKDRAAARARVSDQKQAEAIQKDVRNRLVAWDKEIDTMVEEGVFDKPKKGNEAYKTVDEVFKFMTTQNKARVKDGRGQIESFRDGYDLYMLSKDKKQNKSEEEQEQEDAKKRGGKVRGGKSNKNKNEPVYRPGMYNSIDDVPV